MKEFIATVDIIGAVQGFFLGIVLISRRENRVANNIFASLIIVMSLTMLGRYFMLKELPLAGYWMAFITLPGTALYGPLVYFYTLSMTAGIDSFKKRYLLHLIPFILLVFLNGAAHSGGGSAFGSMPLFMALPLPALAGIGVNIFTGLSYTVYSWVLLKRYNSSIEEFFSDIQRLSLLWLRVLLFFMTAMFVTMNSVYWYTVFVRPPEIRFIFLPVFMVLIVFAGAFFALRQPDLFRAARAMREELDDPVETPVSVKKKYEKHSLDEETGRKYLARLLAYIDREKPYLDENVTIKDLADDLDISAHHLSIVINHYLSQNFYAFINTYRIEEFKKMLAEQQSGQINILEIALASGFNSKSSFNSFFKKITGLTPTEYIKQTGI